MGIARAGDREATLTRIELGGLTFAEARALLGETLQRPPRRLCTKRLAATRSIYKSWRGRSTTRLGRLPAASELSFGVGVPSTVAAALTEELTPLSKRARVVLEGAAVAGDPFEPELAAAAAATSETEVFDAIDELLQLDLIRQTDVPRRFRFRHPLVRRAVYETTPGGWRLGAHERCAEALAARGAAVAARAHHVELSARQGDLDAVELLRKAGEATARLAPGTAARWFGGALRLLPDAEPSDDRVELLLACARSLAAAGHFEDSYEALLEATAVVPEGSSALGTSVATACAGMERFLGRYEESHARLVKALRAQPEPASVESVGLLIELTLNEFYRSRFEEMHDWAGPAVTAAKVLEDPTLLAAALAMPALAEAMTGPTETARAHRAEAAALVDGLSDEELSLRLDGAGWLAAAELYLDLYAEADAHASRAYRLARATGRSDPFGLYQILPRVWYVRGRLVEAAELLDGAIEAGRTAPATPRHSRETLQPIRGGLRWATWTRTEPPHRRASSSLETSTRASLRGLGRGQARQRPAVTGEPERAVELLLGRARGKQARSRWLAELLPGAAHPLLARAGPPRRGGAHSRRAEASAPRAASARRRLGRSRAAAVALLRGDPAAPPNARSHRPVPLMRSEPPSRPRYRATLAGRALAQAGQPTRPSRNSSARRQLRRLWRAALPRGSAERELGKLGHRPHRRTRPGKTSDPASSR